MSGLAYGLRRDLPKDLTCAWGARWIWPNDLVWDRQDVIGEDTAELLDWLNGGPLAQAREEAARLARAYELSPAADTTVTLYEDERGIVRANPQGSSGYLYVAAWLK